MAMRFALFSITILHLAVANPLVRRQNPSGSASIAASYVGQSTSNAYPPSGTQPNTAAFPDESVVGNTGPTPTGAEPFAILTAAAYPTNTEAFPPLVRPVPTDGVPSNPDAVFLNWGNLAPMHSVPNSAYGLGESSPLLPDKCEITQVHLLYRHGARYPTSGSLPSAFAGNLTHVIANGTTLAASGPLEFLNTWNYKLGAELLTPFGRKQNFELGVAFRTLYGGLLNNFTEAGTLPVFRTESQDRMVKTAENFAAGFFGIPFEDQYNLLLMIEAKGINNTGASYETCNNSNSKPGSIGSTASLAYANTAFADTISRLQPYLSGYTLHTPDILAMLQLCAYETHALGYSAFCPVFTYEEFQKFEYYFDISFYYNNFMGSPVSAAQGKGWVEEFVARLTMQQLNSSDSSVNITLQSDQYNPLNQSIYADATHEVIVADILAALNLTSLAASGPLPVDEMPTTHTFVASNIVPFATRLVVQVLECASSQPTKQIRFIVNDAVVPLTYAGCSSDPNGLCAFDTVVSALQERLQEIDFEYACFGNYTVEAGVDYNGLPPKRNVTAA